MNDELPIWYQTNCKCEMCEDYRIHVLNYIMQTEPNLVEPLEDVWFDTFEFIESL